MSDFGLQVLACRIQGFSLNEWCPRLWPAKLKVLLLQVICGLAKNSSKVLGLGLAAN